MKYYICLFLLLISTNNFADDFNLGQLSLPAGFHIKIYAEGIPNARQMVLGDDGVVYVGSRIAGNVYALIPSGGKNNSVRVVMIGQGLNSPNGVAYKDGDLYVAEIDRILKFEKISQHISKPPSPTVIYDSLPKNKHHGWKYIRFGPDGFLYVPIGAPCNICLKKDPRFATISRLKPDGTHFEIFAKGIRNTVGFDWHPETKVLWFTDNGRDWLGDNLPPDELNRAPKKGMHFGFPYLHGKNIQDPKFSIFKSNIKITAPEKELGPHVAALGMKFYTGNMFPKEFKNQIFIAEHGSWNRTTKIGYRIMLVLRNKNNELIYKPFITGWLKNGEVFGRPVDVLVMPDGALLISDDFSGKVYRVTYSMSE